MLKILPLFRVIGVSLVLGCTAGYAYAGCSSCGDCTVTASGAPSGNCNADIYDSCKNCNCNVVDEGGARVGKCRP